MRAFRAVLLGVVLVPFRGPACGLRQPRHIAVLGRKKKLPGVRQEVFRSGVPGVS